MADGNLEDLANVLVVVVDTVCNEWRMAPMVMYSFSTVFWKREAMAAAPPSVTS